jgi:hypothetical protein
MFETTPAKEIEQDPATMLSTCTTTKPAPVVSFTVARITESALI